MNEEQMLARIARQMLEIERLNGCYDHVANTLADVVSGKVAASRVMVNLTDRTYTIAAEGECPPMPATINGLPVCVTAPPSAGGKCADNPAEPVPCTDAP